MKNTTLKKILLINTLLLTIACGSGPSGSNVKDFEDENGPVTGRSVRTQVQASPALNKILSNVGIDWKKHCAQVVDTSTGKVHLLLSDKVCPSDPMQVVPRSDHFFEMDLYTLSNFSSGEIKEGYLVNFKGVSVGTLSPDYSELLSFCTGQFDQVCTVKLRDKMIVDLEIKPGDDSKGCLKEDKYQFVSQAGGCRDQFSGRVYLKAFTYYADISELSDNTATRNACTEAAGRSNDIGWTSLSFSEFSLMAKSRRGGAFLLGDDSPIFFVGSKVKFKASSLVGRIYTLVAINRAGETINKYATLDGKLNAFTCVDPTSGYHL